MKTKRLLLFLISVLILCCVCGTLTACQQNDPDPDPTPSGPSTGVNPPDEDTDPSSGVTPPDEDTNLPTETNPPVENPDPSTDVDLSKLTQLDTPTNVALTADNELIWDKVDNASSYVVKLNNSTYSAKSNVFDCKVLDTAANTVKIKAVGDNKTTYKDSQWTDFYYETPTSGLKYTKLDDGSGYIVTKQSEDSIKSFGTRIVIPDYCDGLPVTEIGVSAFSSASVKYTGNTVTKSIRFPSHLTKIGSGAFKMYNALTKVKLPDSVTELSDSVFFRCTRLSEIELSSNLKMIPGSAFAYTALTEIVIPSGVESIYSSFTNCTSLTSVTIPDSVTTIGGTCFKDCTVLTTIKMSKNIREIDSSAFENTPWLNNQTDEFITFNGNLLYRYNGSAERIDSLPAGIKNVSVNAFYNNNTLKYVSLSGVTFADGTIFYNCTALETIRLSNVSALPNKLVSLCKALTTVILPDTITTVTGSAPYNMSSSVNVFYEGTQEQFEKIAVVGATTWSVTGATVYFYTETQPTTEGNYWHYDADGNPVKW